MKKRAFVTGIFPLLLAVALMTPQRLISQDTISDQLRVKRWIDGQTVNVFGHPVLRVFGATYNQHTIPNNHIPVTNIGYKDPEQLKNETRQRAKAENWPETKLSDELKMLDSVAPGGRLFVYIERRDNDRVRSNYFFVVLRDKNDKKFYMSNVPKRTPEFGDFGFWSNYFVMDIPVKVEYPFFVYVNDRKSVNLSDFKFEILN